MMMPANFTAVNSEVVYGGADLFSILADTTAPVWNAANVKKFNTNLITLISNSFFQKTVSNTLGVMFGGNWGEDKIFGDDGALSTLYKVGHVATGDDQNFGNKIMTTLGLAASVYTLGMKDAAVLTAKKVTNSNGQVWGKISDTEGDGWIG
jgi:hypothetical protein